jgi:hypothetical protein
VERILKSNKTEKLFRFTFGTNNLEMIPKQTVENSSRLMLNRLHHQSAEWCRIFDFRGKKNFSWEP